MDQTTAKRPGRPSAPAKIEQLQRELDNAKATIARLRDENRRYREEVDWLRQEIAGVPLPPAARAASLSSSREAFDPPGCLQGGDE